MPGEVSQALPRSPQQTLWALCRGNSSPALQSRYPKRVPVKSLPFSSRGSGPACLGELIAVQFWCTGSFGARAVI